MALNIGTINPLTGAQQSAQNALANYNPGVTSYNPINITNYDPNEYLKYYNSYFLPQSYKNQTRQDALTKAGFAGTAGWNTSALRSGLQRTSEDYEKLRSEALGSGLFNTYQLNKQQALDEAKANLAAQLETNKINSSLSGIRAQALAAAAGSQGLSPYSYYTNDNPTAMNTGTNNNLTELYTQLLKGLTGGSGYNGQNVTSNQSYYTPADLTGYLNADTGSYDWATNLLDEPQNQSYWYDPQELTAGDTSSWANWAYPEDSYDWDYDNEIYF